MQFQDYSRTAQTFEDSTTSQLYRRMKFLPKQQTTSTQTYSSISRLEQYIQATRNNICTHLPEITTDTHNNMSKNEKNFLKKLKQNRNNITVKPADKNLGIVLMDTDDYVQQCTKELSKGRTYRLANTYPVEAVKTQVMNTLICFKNQLESYNNKLYHYLMPQLRAYPIPVMYGIPKIHKQFIDIPPIRPIVSQCSSVLKPMATFLDHTLQPLAQSYPDYLHNSTCLSCILQELEVPENALLVSVDVESLYPSIPQNDMLETIYQEMNDRRHLLIFDPNLMIKLMYINVNNNYFEFASLIFQQINGMAMGAACSPTIANIYMSVTLRKFLRTQNHKPLLLTRYIDDIFIIWTHGQIELVQFMDNLNQFNNSLRYTYQYSSTSIDFLDLTIYKGPSFSNTKILDTCTFQKTQNLYQYLHYSSNHPKSLFKAIITGELIRYVRTNTREEQYIAMTKLFENRLLARAYPKSLIHKTKSRVLYQDREKYMLFQRKPPPRVYPPIYKCLPPPQYHILKAIILEDYSMLEGILPAPRFISLSYPTLRKEVVRAKVIPTDRQFLDIYLATESCNSPNQVDHGKLPKLQTQNTRIKKCNHPRCITCKHLNCNRKFTSTKTKVSYTIRHNFSCTSKNLIYLITCQKCKKQYVGLTMQKLNTRINHHRSNIFNKKPIYLCVHFNFPDHHIQDLSVQPIDTIDDQTQPLEELRKLERYWIRTLKTLKPDGLNLSTGFPTMISSPLHITTTY